MKAKWIEVVSLRFEGPQFANHAIDLDTLAGLTRFQTLLTTLAKDAWRDRHLDRKNVPRNFERQLRLCLYQIKRGSVVVPLYVRSEPSPNEELFEDMDTVIHQAAGLVVKAVGALGKQEPLPERFPRSLIPALLDWASFESEEDLIEIHVPRRKPVKYNRFVRNRLEALLAEPHVTPVQITGEIFEANVRARRSLMSLPDGTEVSVTFSPDQEEAITSALKDHSLCRVHVSGVGHYSSSGSLSKIVDVTELTVKSVHDSQRIGSMDSFWAELDELSQLVPDEEWRKLPTDLSSNLDHYLYGHKKR